MTRGGPQVIPRPPIVTPGPPPPWRALSPEERRIDADRVRGALARRPGRRPEFLDSLQRASAVLVPLYPDPDDGGLGVLLTRRSGALRVHAGEVSFPGGRIDPGESAFEAAVREAFEEVELPPVGIEPIGELDHRMTVTSRSAIAPVVALLPERPEGLRPNPVEVDAVLLVPLSELTAEGVYREERWGEPPFDRSVHFFDLEGDTVWGATAAMLHDLLTRTLGL